MASLIVSSSLAASRLDRINRFARAIGQHKGRTAAFNALDLQDRTRILGIVKISKFDWTTIEKRGLKGRVQKELQAMSEKLRSLSAKPVPRYSFPFTEVPKAVLTTILGPYLSGKDLTAFRCSFKAAAKLRIASFIIKEYGLQPLIETYLHSSCAGLKESDKTKLLDSLMSFVYQLSIIEKIPHPSYQFLVKLFEHVEARNLLRMVQNFGDEALIIKKLGLSKRIKSFAIPKNSEKAIKKAALIRKSFIKQPDLFVWRTYLNLQGRKLTLLPKEIGQLKSLQVLWLCDNELRTLPKEIWKIQTLQALSFQGNRLVSLPKGIGQLQSLRTLYLYRNCLTTLPNEIGMLRALEYLEVDYNYLSTLPKEIGHLQALKTLILSGNRFPSLSKELGKLKKLQNLSLYNNGLVELPKNLNRFKGQLKNQKKRLQMKTLLDRLILCLKHKHNCKGIAALLPKIEEILGKETRSKLERFLYVVCKKASKTDSKLRAKLKKPKFIQMAFIDKAIDPKFKAIAITQFWKMQ